VREFMSVAFNEVPAPDPRMEVVVDVEWREGSVEISVE
jgi:hypothetical protein